MGLIRSKNLSAAKATCDEWFSKYIRLRDANHNGLCRCITCSTVKHWSDMDCGHFQSRRFTATRWEEKNAHAQCQSCNNYGSGEQYRHGIEIDSLYGAGTAQELEEMARLLHKWNKDEVMAMARYYKQECEQLIKEKII